MKIRSLALSGVAFASAWLLQIRPASAQTEASPPPVRPNGGPTAEQREQFRQRMAERLKAMMKANDEEWAVIQPRLEQVQIKQREAMGGGRFFGGGPGGQNGNWRGQRAAGEGGDNNSSGGNNNNPDRGPRGMRGGGGTPEAQALRASLEAEGTSPSEIKAQLQALRDARVKAAAELEQARADLKKVLNMRQEALLVLMGVLD